MIRAAQAGFLNSFPKLTPTLIANYYTHTSATAFGHLDRTRKNARSTQPSSTDLTPTLPNHTTLFLKLYRPTNTNYSDATGDFIPGALHFLIMYHYDLNLIHVELPKDHTASEYVRAYNRGLEFYRSHDPTFVPTIEVMDNIRGDDIRTNLRRHNIQLQLVAANNHRTNNAERAIRTFKNHWIATIAGCSRFFPQTAYRHLVPHVEQTLNLMRASRINPNKSAYEMCNNRPYDYNANPLFIPGHRAVIWDSPADRKSFANHGTEAFYIHGAPLHYRNAYFFVPSTGSVRTSDSIYWLPDPEPNPPISHLPPELLSTLATEVTDTEPPTIRITNPTMTATYLPPTNVGLPMAIKPEYPANSEGAPHSPPTASSPPSSEGAPDPDGYHAANTAVHVPTNPNHTTATTTPNTNTTNTNTTNHTTATTTTNNHTTTLTTTTTSTTPNTTTTTNTNILPTSTDYTSTEPIPAVDPTAISYLKTIKRPGPTADLARAAFVQELRRVINDTNTIVRIEHLPKGVSAPRPNPILKYKCTDGQDAFRCRLTYNGRLSTYTGTRSSSTIDILSVKCFLNSIISDADCTHITADIKDFYLQHKLDHPEYTSFPISWIPRSNRSEFNVANLPDDATLFYRIDKALYGMPQAGMIAQRELTRHLAQHGYVMSPNTPCHYTHISSGVSFVLWVDDFLIKYKTANRSSLDHLLTTLRLKYQIDLDPTGSSYIGLTIQRHPDRLTISMPGYVQRMAQELNLTLRPNPPKSPILPPSTGRYTSHPQLETIDTSPEASPQDKHNLQIICGKLLYYTLAVDPTIQVAVCKIASDQSRATHLTMQAADRLLQYVLANPDAIITYYPSNMILVAHSDASHDSEPLSRSRAGGFYSLGNADFQGIDNPTTLNGPISCLSKLIDTVCAGAYESEYAALYLNATNLEAARQTLEDFGFPQPSTVVYYDNTVAGDIAYKRCKQRRSKAIARRYHWIQDRISMGHFNLQWRAGKLNLADFFTKAHPVAHFQKMLPNFITFPTSKTSS